MPLENKISYRKADVKDISALQNLGLISYGVFQNKLSVDNWEIMKSRIERKELYAELIEKGNAFVGQHNRKIAGMAFLMPSGNPNHIYADDWSVIRMLGVHPNFTGHGIAKTLTQMCVEQARSNKEKIIALHTSPEIMQNAIRIYQKAGFKFHKDIDPIFGVKYQVYKMEL